MVFLRESDLNTPLDDITKGYNMHYIITLIHYQNSSYDDSKLVIKD